ncbi:MAG: hypothetical protein H6537_06540 [Bacteroidales bacterium]|nr:hypothetical protein [Bacteroidales bacterium]HPD95266.1 hypothetical protein [Tenuifilaceae bacterium]HRX31463.1 hypothetical protein [Tenuifilaceae bacterium]
MEPLLSNKDIQDRIYEYSRNVGFDTQRDAFKDLISFLVDIDENFIYCLLKPEERESLVYNSLDEKLLKIQLHRVVESL